MSVSIYYGTQSDIRVKRYCQLNLLRASFFNLKRLHILRDSIGYRSLKLLWFAFATCLYVFNFKHLDMVWDSFGHPRKKLLSFELVRAFVFIFEHLVILQDLIVHPTKKLLWFAFATCLCFQFRASRYSTRFIRTSK